MIRIRQNTPLIVVSVLFLFATVCAKASWWMESLFTNYFRYALALGLIAYLGLVLFQNRPTHSLAGRSLTYQTLWLMAYMILFLLEYQLLVETPILGFGLSVETVNGIQKLAALFLSWYILSYADTRFCKVIVWAYLLLIALDCGYSLYYLSDNNEILRASSWTYGEEFLKNQHVYGACSANNIYSFVVAVPLIWVLMKNETRKRTHLLILAILILTIVTVFLAGFTMAMGLLAFVLLYILFNRVVKNPVARSLCIMLAFLWLVVFGIDGTLAAVQNIVGSASVQQRIGDIRLLLSSGDLGEASGARFASYSHGIEGFLQSPLIGNVLLSGERFVSGHSTLIDMLSDWGIFGFVIYMGYIINMCKASTSFGLKQDRVEIRVALIAFWVTLAINKVGGYINSIAIIAVFASAVTKYVYLSQPDAADE